MTAVLLVSLVMSAEPTEPARAWSGFRHDGSSRTSARALPLRWSEKENIAWRASLPGYGQSSPVVWKDRIFVTAVAGADKERCLVSALDCSTGKQLWQKKFLASQKGKNNPMMSRAAPTPVVDAAGLYVFFESGDLIGLTHEGEVRWQRSLVKEYGPVQNNHGLGSSLAETAEAVIVLVDHAGPSFLLAVDKKSGKNLWRIERASRTSWTSPLVTVQDGRGLVLVSSSGSVTAYNAATGEELWRHDGLSGNNIPSPTALGDLVVIGAGENRQNPDLLASARSNCCLRLTYQDGKPNYDLIWQAKKAIAHHASPVIHRGHVYIVNRQGFVHCLDVNKGEPCYVERLDNPCWATPVAAGEYIYFFGKDGVTTILAAGPKFKKVASNPLWRAEDFQKRKERASNNPENQLPERAVASASEREGSPPVSREVRERLLGDVVGDVVYGVAVVEGTVFLRTGTELYCIREVRQP